jgi:tRNA(Ile)-lysidine synthase
MRSHETVPDNTPAVPLKAAVERFLTELDLPAGSIILAAFSGGPDSTALVSVLHALSLRSGFSLVCAYYDHGIRPSEERAEELSFVTEFAASLGLQLEHGAADPGAIERTASVRGLSVEDAARRMRYRFLERAARKTGARYIALGHTRDDQLETVVMRFFQGADPGGLSGIPARRGRVIRPLLGSTRVEILAYLAERGIGYRIDSSNLAPLYLRNRIRLELMPVIESVFPGFGTALDALRSRMAGVNAFLERESERRIVWLPHGAGFAADREAFLAAPAVLRARAVFRVFNLMKLRPSGYRLPYRFLMPAAEAGPDTPDRVLIRGHGLVLRLAGNRVFAEHDIVQYRKTGYAIPIDIVENASYSVSGIMTIRVTTFRSGMYGGNDPWIDTDAVRLPLVLRERRSGDTIPIKEGRKSVAKLLSEWKVPLRLRPAVPVLEDREGILAVLGGVYGNRVAPRAARRPAPDGMLTVFTITIRGV